MIGRTRPLRCSFCGKTQQQVFKLVAGPKVHICDGCIETCVEAIRPAHPVPAPLEAAELARRLGEATVAGAATLALLAAVLAHHLAAPPPGGRAPRVLLVGPPGSGKSHLARALGDVSDLPAMAIDLNRVTATGYIGEDVENVIADLVQAAGDDVALAQRGLLVFDGLHHLAAAPRDGQITRDVGARDVQRHLLRVLEGATCRVGPGARHPQAPGTLFEPAGTLCVLVATTDAPLDDPRGLRDALRAAGVMEELLARIDVIVPVPAVAGPALARAAGLVAARRGCPLAAEAQAELAAAAAGHPDGLWALERAVLARRLGLA